MCVGIFVGRCKSKSNRFMDSYPRLKNEKKSKESNNVPDVGDVLQPVWFRCDSDKLDEVNRIILWSQLGFVLPYGTLLWILFFIFG